ncbi:hypothetical protein [Leucothrix mucor]|uniref:hypothetical protein n=1 Tax=Leucothrix mucor TaxID=45248 RepID=UPI0003B54E60|nr:hypothetical protein [Leucothrix mucor]
MITLVMLMMPLLSLWSTPFVHGEKVYLCTFQGIQAFTLTPDQKVVKVQVDSDLDECTALKLVKAFTHAESYELHFEAQRIHQQLLRAHAPPEFSPPLILSYNSQAPPHLIG